ncbi:unnamed protein product [Schistosoma mattheei]|uniref:Uncharacterized protein n=1 Tax=Schistosoma mattheei TaxID=31246 RepID=A0A183NJL6_9TREM|nr:unnamed protein product [Schistosoma mattheei]
MKNHNLLETTREEAVVNVSLRLGSNVECSSLSISHDLGISTKY